MSEIIALGISAFKVGLQIVVSLICFALPFALAILGLAIVIGSFHLLMDWLVTRKHKEEEPVQKKRRKK